MEICKMEIVAMQTFQNKHSNQMPNQIPNQINCTLARKLLLSLLFLFFVLLLTPSALSQSFVFPANVSIGSDTLSKADIDSKRLKSVGLRNHLALAGNLRSNILSPQSNSKASALNSLVLVKISADGKHARYSQRFNGYEVFGGEIIAHLDRQGANLDRVTGNFITGLEVVGIAKKANLKVDQAIDKAIDNASQLMGASHKWQLQNRNAELIIYHNPNKENFKPALAYIVSFMAMSETADPTRPITIIDAVTGEVIDGWEGLNT